MILRATVYIYWFCISSNFQGRGKIFRKMGQVSGMMNVCAALSHSVVSDSVMLDCNLPDSSVHEDFPRKNNGVGCHALLQQLMFRCSEKVLLLVDALVGGISCHTYYIYFLRKVSLAWSHSFLAFLKMLRSLCVMDAYLICLLSGTLFPFICPHSICSFFI